MRVDRNEYVVKNKYLHISFVVLAYTGDVGKV